jgi:hypothetical protein
MLVARLEVLGSMDRRGAVRYEVDTLSTLRGYDGEPFDVIVTDFSRTGFAFVGDVDLRIGTIVSVGLSGAGAREARVLWCHDSSHGCQFLEPLTPEQIAKAFRGQKHVLAELEEALWRRKTGLPPLKLISDHDDDPPRPPMARRRARLAAMLDTLRGKRLR